MKTKTRKHPDTWLKASFVGIVKQEPRRRSSVDGRKFVLWMVAEYKYGQYEWRHSMEFPVDTPIAEARKKFPATIKRSRP